jgi:methyltransferase
VVASRLAYLALLGAFAVERCFEMLLSRANARAAFANGAIESGRAHYPFMVAMHAAFFVGSGAEVFMANRPFPGALGFVALALVLLAQALRYAAVRALGKRWNVRIIVWPREDPVTSGPYRWLRHPNYLAVTIEVCFLPLVHGAWITAAVFSLANACLLRVRIREEERALGPAYAAAFGLRARYRS